MRIRKPILLAVAAVLVAAGALAASRYVAVGCGYWDDAGSCLSLAFDKHKVRGVDRVVLRVGDTTVEVTDRELIRQLKEELMVAGRTDLRVPHARDGKYILFYRGDELVRQMRWEYGPDAHWVEVYTEDAAHWVLFSYSDEGLVCLSDETAEALDGWIHDLEFPS